MGELSLHQLYVDITLAKKRLETLRKEGIFEYFKLMEEQKKKWPELFEDIYANNNTD